MGASRAGLDRACHMALQASQVELHAQLAGLQLPLVQLLQWHFGVSPALQHAQQLLHITDDNQRQPGEQPCGACSQRLHAAGQLQQLSGRWRVDGSMCTVAECQGLGLSQGQGRVCVAVMWHTQPRQAEHVLNAGACLPA